MAYLLHERLGASQGAWGAVPGTPTHEARPPARPCFCRKQTDKRPNAFHLGEGVKFSADGL